MTPASADVLAELAKVSPTFCPLRWTYMQVDLQHGKVKACCKTPFVNLGAAELAAGTPAIFDNDTFARRRQEMLDGASHSDCDDCRTQEELGLLSYRASESAKPLHRPEIDRIARTREVRGAAPRHIELIFRTSCDLSCSYCGPDFSSAWAAELQRHGPYPVPHLEGEPPPGPEAFARTFWQWFEENRASVRYVQVNGGEPLLQPELYEFFDRALAGEPTFDIGIITNLNTPERLLEKIDQRLPALIERHHFRLGVSQDAVGRRAEYIRRGLSWARFERNLRYLASAHPSVDLQIAPTMSALNVTGISELLTFLARLADETGVNLELRPSIVMAPGFLNPGVLTRDHARYLDEAVALLERLNRWPQMAERLREIEPTLGRLPQLEVRRRELARWIAEYDRRSGTRLGDAIPELAPFLQSCGEAAGA